MDTEMLKQKAGLAPYKRRLKLQKDGKGYKARCPWHDDNDPSLSFFLKNGIWLWKCWPCNKGGDVIKFVELIEKVDFKSAVEVITAESGITSESVNEAEKFSVNKAIAIAALNENPAALEYLASRGISPEIAEQAGVGFADYPGIGASLSIPYSDDIIKFRTIDPNPDKTKKFRHLLGHGSNDLLYGIEVLESSAFLLEPDLYIVESELDCLTMRSSGFSSVSVSSATSCLGNSGNLTIKDEDVRKLDSAERIFIATDMDETGQKCAHAFEKALPTYKVYRIQWPYGGKESADPKDIGEI